eukprot:2267788-Rhodomonas_salina.1
MSFSTTRQWNHSAPAAGAVTKHEVAKVGWLIVVIIISHYGNSYEAMALALRSYDSYEADFLCPLPSARASLQL